MFNISTTHLVTTMRIFIAGSLLDLSRCSSVVPGLTAAVSTSSNCNHRSYRAPTQCAGTAPYTHLSCQKQSYSTVLLQTVASYKCNQHPPAMPSADCMSGSAAACHTTDSATSFMYFAFGSNLLTERIHINNPSAKFVDVAKLEGYQLDFNYFSQRWRGAAATVTPAEEGDTQGLGHVWGVLWQINIEDMQNLDIQEGVKMSPACEHIGVYRPLQVPVLRRATGDTVTARTYQLIQTLQQDRRPSKVYLDVIKSGAKENGLPQEYQEFLESIEHNGYDSEVDVKLNYQKV